MATPHTPVELSPRMQRVLALDGPTFGRPRPTPDELKAIRAVLAEGPPAAKRLNLARAMFIAADNAPDEETARLLAAILHGGDAGMVLRRQAAAMLGHITAPLASHALAAALEGSGPGLEATILKALARNGDADAARMIAARPATDSDRLARLRDFTRGLIGLRTGAELDRAAQQALLPTGRPVQVRQEAAAEAAAVLEGFRGSTYGLRLNPNLAFGYRCNGVHHVVLLSQELARGKLLSGLAERARLAGLVAMQDERGSANYLARRLVVTRPGRDGIEVAVLALDGTVDLLGSLRPQARGHALVLRSQGRGAGTAVDGLLTDEGLELEVRVFGQVARKRLGDIDPAAA